MKKYFENKVFDINAIDIKDYNRKQRIKFHCCDCNIEVIKNIGSYMRSSRCKQCSLKKMSASYKQTILNKYGVDNVFASSSIKNKCKETKLSKYGNANYINSKKAKETNLQRYGNEVIFKTNHFKEESLNTRVSNSGSIENSYKKSISKSIKTKQEKYGNLNNFTKIEKTCSDKYGVKNFMLSVDFKEKSKNTLLSKYNTDNIMKCNEFSQKAQETCLKKYGVRSFSQTEEFQSKRRKKFIYKGNSFDSSWELIFWLYAEINNLNIKKTNKCFTYYVDGKPHKYFPDFEIDDTIYEIKGDQFFKNHDSNDVMINPFDESQNKLFAAKQQCAIDHNVKFITKEDIKNISIEVNNIYTKDFVNLFYTKIDFPYVNENFIDKSDYGVIQHFHKSIYDASRKGKPSPKKAWDDKNLILKSALNRLKYVKSCKPSDILQGFNVAKIAPKVSVFKPKFAETLIKKYLDEYEQIFDPFSGFSGRLIGAMNCNKYYVGQDINADHIRESKEIIHYKNYQTCSILQQDILTDTNKLYESLFTCPPYSGKEHWNENNDEIEKSCDEWIDICLSKYKCKKYLFVVDKTEKYKNFIVDKIENKSHFGSNFEYIILIKGEDR